MGFFKNCLSSVVEDTSEVFPESRACFAKVGRQVAQTFNLHKNSGEAKLNFC